ncbi:hypothetical protein LCGC14_1650600 [marine sediment metagenome]|uniref:Uncharacterized protein n=1 Tax=marine sediment metagenome TaxID=412755 RepID=A0A0F9KCQ1_9ZZZZ
MAKINPGPLASSISGSVGNITFERTRFGQVVQRKPIPPTHTTTAAMAIKDRFRQGMAGFFNLDADLRTGLRLGADTYNKAQTSPWLTTWMRYWGGAPWQLPAVPRPDVVLQVTGIVPAGAWTFISTNLDAPFPEYSCHVGYLKDGQLVGVGPNTYLIPLVIPRQPLLRLPALLPYDFLLIPTLFVAYDQIGVGITEPGV